MEQYRENEVSLLVGCVSLSYFSLPVFNHQILAHVNHQVILFVIAIQQLMHNVTVLTALLNF